MIRTAQAWRDALFAGAARQREEYLALYRRAAELGAGGGPAGQRALVVHPAPFAAMAAAALRGLGCTVAVAPIASLPDVAADEAFDLVLVVDPAADLLERDGLGSLEARLASRGRLLVIDHRDPASDTSLADLLPILGPRFVQVRSFGLRLAADQRRTALDIARHQRFVEHRAGDLDGDAVAGGGEGDAARLWLASAPRARLGADGPLRLHVGAGAEHVPGWLGIDIRPFPGVDVVADVTRGLEFDDVEAVFAEHFLEHLAFDHALDFLGSVRGMLRPDGRLRLSTPNLDWVWTTHYRTDVADPLKLTAAFALNKAFYGWEHKFLWNRQMLTEALTAVGFGDLTWHLHGESHSPVFQGLERHETYDDSEGLPHVLIVEAAPGTSSPERLAALRARAREDFLCHVAGY